MRKRNVRYQLWLNEQEAERLTKLVNRTKLPREVYLRHLINDLVPTDAPPPDYFAMMKELRQIGVSLRQIAHKALMLNVIDTKPYFENIAALNNAVVEITNAVMLPRKIERQHVLSQQNNKAGGRKK